MRYFYFLLFSLCNLAGHSQSLTVSESSATSRLSTNEFLVAGHTLRLSEGIPDQAQPALTGDVNTLTAISGALSQDGVALYSGSSTKLAEVDYNPSDDSSLKLYVKPNGAFALRENIANFLFYGADGTINQSISNSSQSQEGESISELAADPAYKTIVLYNPKIIRGGNDGSRAQVVGNNGTTNGIYYSENRVIRFVDVSENGQFIGIITFQNGTEDQVTITDRFGNELNTISFNQDIVDVNFSDDGRYIAIRSNGRVAVYSIISGDRIGSSSFRSTLHFAAYVSQENMIIAVTGEESSGSISDVEVHAVNLTERSIERTSYNETLGTTESIPVQLTRNATNSYTITGFNKILNIRIN